MDFSINRLSTGGYFKDANITTDPQHRTKLKQITRAILMPRFLFFLKKFYHPFMHVCIFGNMFPESHGFVSVQVKHFWLPSLIR